MNARILNGTDRAQDNGYPDLKSMLVALAAQRGIRMSGKVSNDPVYARIDYGRWLADCECGGAGYVDPANTNIFFCLVCGNHKHHGDFRPVIFPPDREAIELEVLKRPVEEQGLLPHTDAALNSRPMIPGLVRNWNPTETVDDLAGQRKLALKVAED